MNNIAGQRDIGLLLHKVTNNLRAAGPFRADVNFSGFPVHCSAEPVRREICVYVQLGKAFDIPVGNQEQVTYRDLDFQRPTQRALCLLDCVENIPGCTVTRRMHVQINVVAIQFLHEAAQSLRREQDAAVVVRVCNVGLPLLDEIVLVGNTDRSGSLRVTLRADDNGSPSDVVVARLRRTGESYWGWNRRENLFLPNSPAPLRANTTYHIHLDADGAILADAVDHAGGLDAGGVGGVGGWILSGGSSPV